MDLILLLKAAVMGVVEGLTEFLPISSTGHLILAGSLLHWTDEKAKAFEIIIQAGAILAVCWEFRARILGVAGGLLHDASAQRFAINLAIAFLPAAVLGAAFNSKIKAVLFAPVPVATAFIVGGFVILWVERGGVKEHGVRVRAIDDVTALDALKIGAAQALALIPGTSRSGATIIGGMLFGLSREVATEFSFFLAIPTLLAATAFSLFKERGILVASDASPIAIGFVTSFVSAFFCVRWLLRYVATHDFRAFAYYRIVFGLLVLATAYFHLVNWVD